MNTPRMGLPDRLADTLSMPEQHEYLRRAFSRRGLLRGGAVAATGAALAGTAAGAAAATPTLVPGSAAATVHGSLVAPFGLSTSPTVPIRGRRCGCRGRCRCRSANRSSASAEAPST